MFKNDRKMNGRKMNGRKMNGRKMNGRKMNGRRMKAFYWFSKIILPIHYPANYMAG
ncbi:MAG: hypothetical protein ONB44_08705 [candidate division KSB1 bacterium]|nr:hypothetical protein [candidate division KSB1 bacterium]